MRASYPFAKIQSVHPVTVQLSSPNTGVITFQSVDRSAGRIYLRMTRPIRYLPTLCFLDPDNRSIASRRRRSVSKRIRLHN